MAADDRKSAIGGGTTGGTSGTGQPDTTPEAQADSHGEVAERVRDGDSLAGGDASTDAALGEGGARRVAGTGSTAGQSGRLSTEGTGADLPNPPDAGDPGGMGGVAANRERRHDRPPGGNSPVAPDEK